MKRPKGGPTGLLFFYHFFAATFTPWTWGGRGHTADWHPPREPLRPALASSTAARAQSPNGGCFDPSVGLSLPQAVFVGALQPLVIVGTRTEQQQQQQVY